MSDASTSRPAAIPLSRYLPDLPLVIWMVLLALTLGLAGGKGATELVTLFNDGFGRSLGEFALILLPSFTLAAALTRQNVVSEAAGRAAALVSPVAGAGMICPDTAYAALSPAAGRHKLDTAFGAYAGFKLLYPAGPLIVAAGLGANEVDPLILLGVGGALTLPVWAAGAAWARWVLPNAAGGADGGTSGQEAGARRLVVAFAPFLLMAGLLLVGGVAGGTGVGVADFLFSPKGALLAAALLALLQVPPAERRECLDSAVRRTGSLLLVIGAASAFGAVLTDLVPIGALMPQGSGVLGLLALFMLTVLFKLAQGSSMATFAAVAPVAAPLVAASGIGLVPAVFAICLGSFIAILPNDSYYWLVRRDALAKMENETKAIAGLAGGTIVQAATGMALLLFGILLWS